MRNRWHFFGILLIIPLVVYAAVTSITNDGNWSDPGIWSNGIADDISEDADMDNNIGAVIIQSGEFYTISDLDMKNGNTLTIDLNGGLTIGEEFNEHNLAVGNTSTINVDGSLEIWGILDIGNTLVLNVNGSTIIHGNVKLGNNAKLDIQGNVTIDGDLVGGNNADVNVDGIVNIGGSLTFGNNSELSGDGTINVDGDCNAPADFCEKVNIRPRIESTTSSLDYTENDGASVLNTNLAVIDMNDTDLEGATISFENTYIETEDLLSFTNQSGITGNFDGPTGILTLTGTATVAAYQTALRSLTYENVSDDPDVTSRVVRFIISDGSVDSHPFDMQISITAVNDKPSISGALTSLQYTEGDGAKIIDGTVLVADLDDTQLASATISISNNFLSTEDALGFSDQFNITGSYVSATGILTLTGIDDVANYTAALQTITYENSSVSPDLTPRTIRFVVNDGTLDSDPFERVIEIIPVIEKPEVSSVTTSLSYIEDAGAVVLNENFEISDNDDVELESAKVIILDNYLSTEDILASTDQLGISGSFVSETGTLNLTGAATLADYQTTLRTITYENTSQNPDLDARGVHVIANDGDGDGDPFVMQIDISPINDIPTLTGSVTPLQYPEGIGPLAVDGSIVVSDVDDTHMELAVISIVTNFTDTEDVLAFTDQSGITGNYVAATGVLTLTGSSINADFSTAMASIAYENISASPNLDARTIRFVINDGDNNSDAFERTIEISSTNNKPAVTSTFSNLTYTEGDGAVAVNNGLLAIDIDDNQLTGATISIQNNYIEIEDVLAFNDQSGITGNFDAISGVLTLTGIAAIADYQVALRSITYENTSENPNLAPRAVQIIVKDGAVDSDPFDMSIDITILNDPPQISGNTESILFTEGQGTILIGGLTSITDIDNALLSSAEVAISNNYVTTEDVLTFIDQIGITGSFDGPTGILTLAGSANLTDYVTALNSITYENDNEDPSPSNRTIQFIVFDGEAWSLPLEKVIEIEPVNDKPTLTSTITNLEYAENGDPVPLNPIFECNDVDNDNLALATIRFQENYFALEDFLSVSTQPSILSEFDNINGVLTLSGTASVAEYQSALRSVTYQNLVDNPDPSPKLVHIVLNDGNDNSEIFEMQIVVVGVNDRPTISGNPQNLLYTESDGKVVLDPTLAISDPDDVNIELATIAITTNFIANQDMLHFSNQLGIKGFFDPALGVLTLSGNASLDDYMAALSSITYENTSIAPSLFVRIIEFIVNDGDENSEPFKRNILIDPINQLPELSGSEDDLDYTEGDGPIAVDFNIEAIDVDDIYLENATITFSNNYLLGEDVLVFTNQLDITGSLDVSQGVLLLSGTSTLDNYQLALQTITYENVNDNPSIETRTVSFVVNDGDGNSNIISRNIHISPTNDPPVAEDDQFNGLEDEELNGNILINDSDPDGDPLLVNTTPMTSPQNGILTINPDGSFLYVPNPNFFGTDGFEYEICDNADPSLCDIGTVTIILDEVVEPLQLYQGVTPNGDEFNDTWIIQGIDKFPNNTVQIFDRWSSLVYEESGYNNLDKVWKGQSNAGVSSGELPSGYYFYIVNLGDGSPVKDGFVVLQR